MLRTEKHEIQSAAKAWSKICFQLDTSCRDVSLFPSLVAMLFIDVNLQVPPQARKKGNIFLMKVYGCWSFFLSVSCLREDKPLRCKLMENSINLNNWKRHKKHRSRFNLETRGILTRPSGTSNLDKTRTSSTSFVNEFPFSHMH